MVFKKPSYSKRSSAILKIKFDGRYAGAKIRYSKCIWSKRYEGAGEWTIKYDYRSWCRRNDTYRINYTVKKPTYRRQSRFRKDSMTASRIVSFKIDGEDMCKDDRLRRSVDVNRHENNRPRPSINAHQHLYESVSDIIINQAPQNDTVRQLGGSCDQFLTPTNAWQGGWQGNLMFTLPIAVSSWKVIVSISMFVSFFLYNSRRLLETKYF